MEETAGGAVKLEIFEYPACPGDPLLPSWGGWLDVAEDLDTLHGHNDGGMRGAAGSGLDERAPEAAQRSLEEARERGRQEGREKEREAQAGLLAEERLRHKEQLAALVARFSGESERFLAALERETVKLALAIAARILRREAQMDPLLLTGSVRVALGQLAASSEVRLRVPAEEADMWTETVAGVPNLAVKPVVIAENGMRAGDCVVECKIGTVDLGVRSQLAEIERGFFDRAGEKSSRRRMRDEQQNGESPKPAVEDGH